MAFGCLSTLSLPNMESQPTLNSEQATIREATFLTLKIKEHLIERIVPYNEHIHFLLNYLETLLRRLSNCQAEPRGKAGSRILWNLHMRVAC